MQIVDLNERDKRRAPAWLHIVGGLLALGVLVTIVIYFNKWAMTPQSPPLPAVAASQADIIVQRDAWDRMPASIVDNVRACPENTAALQAMDTSGSFNLSQLKVCLHGLWEFNLTDGKTINPAHEGIPASMSLVSITADGRTDYVFAYKLEGSYRLLAALLRDDTIGGAWRYGGGSDFSLDLSHRYTFILAAYLPEHMDTASHFMGAANWGFIMQQAVTPSPHHS
jgi:hypothetical protein